MKSMDTQFQDIRKFPRNQEVVHWIQNLAPWNVFGTITFRYEVKDPIKVKIYLSRFVKRLLREDFYSHIDYFLAVERFTGNYYLHTHLLMYVVEYPNSPFSPDLYPLWIEAFKTFGRSKFEYIKKQDDVSRYIAKYLFKTYIYDFDIHISNAG